ncbi:protein TolR [Desulfobacterales bacterium HSG16]|nr:protein TolR [Desulfobacterales bacterium HSG16]
MAFKSGNDQYMSEINVTPFVDVMLVLLIIFMVTAPMMTEGVDVNLPQASAKPLPVENDQLIISIDKDRKIFIGKFEAEPDTFQEQLKKILQNREDKSVYLKGDKDIPYGIVAKVMSEIKEAGVAKLGMITTPSSLTGPDGDKTP